MKFLFFLIFIFRLSYADDFQLINTEQQLNTFTQSSTLNVLVFGKDRCFFRIKLLFEFFRF